MEGQKRQDAPKEGPKEAQKPEQEITVGQALDGCLKGILGLFGLMILIPIIAGLLFIVFGIIKAALF